MSFVEKPRIRNFYAVKVTAGQEINVALTIEERVKVQGISEIHSIIVPPNLKGYVILEAEGPHVVKLVTAGLRYVKGVTHGLLSRDDIFSLISKKTAEATFKPGDIVEVVSGPFKGMQAQVIRLEEGKGEVVLKILESAYPLQVTVPVDYIKTSKNR